MALVPGDVVGGFVVEARLGGGGMGQVYRARDPALDRRVALKLLDASQLGPDGTLRFQREAELAARVEGLGGVVRVHARGVHRGAPFMVMELVEGHDLEHLLGVGALDAARAAALVEEVARTLDRCHALGVVHRDLKPANVLVRTSDGAPLVVDFGVARGGAGDRLTVTGALVGTPAYMAPEQALDAARAVDPRVDVYALGAILYRALAGRAPPSLLERVGREVPPPSRLAERAVDPALEAICVRAMARDPARRHASAGALADALAAWRLEPREVARRRGLVRAVMATLGAALFVVVVILGARVAVRVGAAHALKSARALEAVAVPALLLSEVAPITTLDPRALHAAADDLAVPGAGAEDVAAAERLTACARLLERAAPERRAFKDPVARAADALLAASAEGPARALKRLDPHDEGPITLAVEGRLSAGLKPPELVAWGAAVRGTAAGARARPRVVAALADACRAAASSDEAALRAAEELLAATGDPAAAQEAIDAAAPAWEALLLRAVEGGDGGELAVLRRLERLVVRSGAAPGPALREVVGRVFAALHEHFWSGSITRKRAQVAAWDDAVARLDPTIQAPDVHLQFLRALIRTGFSRDLPAEYVWACARRGAEPEDGFGWDELGAARVVAPEPLRTSADEPSAAVRFVETTAATYDALGRPPRSDSWKTAVSELPAPLRASLCDGLERVLQAPVQDLAPRFEAEVRALLAQGRLEQARALPVDAAGRGALLRAAGAHAQARLAIDVADAPLVHVCLVVIDEANHASGGAPGEVLAPLERGLRLVEDALRRQQPDERVAGLRRELCQSAQLRAARLLDAGQPLLAVEALRAMLARVPPFTVAERSLLLTLEALRAPAARAVIFDEFRDVVEDAPFMERVIARDLERGRVAEARDLLERARRESPHRPGWAALEARLR